MIVIQAMMMHGINIVIRVWLDMPLQNVQSPVQKQNHLNISSACIEINLMNNPQHNPMRKRFAYATAVVFAIAIMTTIPFNGVLPSTAVAQQQRINSDTSPSQSTNSSSNPLPLKTIFKQVENAVVQVTSKIPTTGVPNPLNPQSPNVTESGSGFVYDKQGHIVTNGHVVGPWRQSYLNRI